MPLSYGTNAIVALTSQSGIFHLITFQLLTFMTVLSFIVLSVLSIAVCFKC